MTYCQNSFIQPFIPELGECKNLTPGLRQLTPPMFSSPYAPAYADLTRACAACIFYLHIAYAELTPSLRRLRFAEQNLLGLRGAYARRLKHTRLLV